jgi:hypothetical protein
MRTNLEDNKARDIRLGPGLILESMDLVPADNFPIDAAAPPLIFLNPAGAIDVLMPTSSAARKGLTFIVVNQSANAITFKTDGDAAFTQAIVAAAGQTVILICTGSATQAVGWRGHSAAGTQTSP